ncbi:MAG: hypothetical protein ABIP07_01065 [Sphingomicrobium sp.]
MPANRPPRSHLTVNIGITGHRAHILPPGVMGALEQAVDDVLCELREAALRIQGADMATFGSEPAQLRLHTPLATGADQLAAKFAHASGYHVRALLPFALDEYRKDFEVGHELAEFDQALDAADEIVAMAGERSDLEGAYVLVGKAVIAAADILVAIWDGGEGNGPGGTAHVVDLALASSVPVIHIAIDREHEKISTRLLVGGDAVRPIAQPLSGPDAYDALLRETLKR